MSKLWGSLHIHTGVSFFLKRGDIWNETLEINNLCGAAEDPNRLSAYGAGDKPKIYRNMKLTEKCVIMKNCQNWIIEDLEVGHCGALGIALRYEDAGENKNMVIDRCVFHHIYGIEQFKPQKGEDYQFSSGIGVLTYLSKNSNGADCCYLRNFTVKNCRSYLCGSLLAQGGKNKSGNPELTRAKDIYIENCICEHNTIYGVTIGGRGGHMKNCKFLYNGTQHIPVGSTAIMMGFLYDYTISDCEIAYQQRINGDPDGCGIDFEVACYNVTVERCYIHHNAGSGVMFYNNSGLLNYGCTIRNCIFENNNQNGFIPSGNEIYTQCIPNNEGGNIYNNTYYQMPGVKFTNLIDSSVELRNNKEITVKSENIVKKVYRASDAFNFYNGNDGWYYLSMDDNGLVDKLVFRPKQAQFGSSANPYCVVGRTWQQPNGLKVVRRWVAQYDGKIAVASYGNIRLKSLNTQGVWVCVKHNETEIFKNSKLNSDQSICFSPITCNVKRGDYIDFITDNQKANEINTVIWDPLIIYNCENLFDLPKICNTLKSNYELSRNFSELQGANNWYYLSKNKDTYNEIPYIDKRNRYESDSDFITQNAQSSKCGETVRKWIAPRAGKISIPSIPVALESLNENISVSITIKYNDKTLRIITLKTGERIETEFLEFEINQGDSVCFITKMQSESGLSLLSWCPTVAYVYPVDLKSISPIYVRKKLSDVCLFFDVPLKKQFFLNSFVVPDSGTVKIAFLPDDSFKDTMKIRIIQENMVIFDVKADELLTDKVFSESFYFIKGQEISFILESDREINNLNMQAQIYYI